MRLAGIGVTDEFLHVHVHYVINGSFLTPFLCKWFALLPRRLFLVDIVTF